MFGLFSISHQFKMPPAPGKFINKPQEQYYKETQEWINTKITEFCNTLGILNIGLNEIFVQFRFGSLYYLQILLLVVLLLGCVNYVFFSGQSDIECRTFSRLELLESIKKAEAQGLTELRVIDLSRKNMIAIIVDYFSSFFGNIYGVLTFFLSTLSFFNPFIAILDFMNMNEFIHVEREAEERERIYRERSYESTVIVGWNAFEYSTEVVNGIEKPKAKLFIPTELEFEFAEVLHDDPKLLEKVLDVVKAPQKTELINNRETPDFMVMFENKKDQSEVMIRLMNKLSETLKSSKWVDYFHRRKMSKAVEPAIFVLTCEKGEDVPRKYSRVWIIFESELKWIYNVSDEDIENPNGLFKLDRENWRIRLRNLKKWARAEYEEDSNGKLIRRGNESKYLSQTLNLPLKTL